MTSAATVPQSDAIFLASLLTKIAVRRIAAPGLFEVGFIGVSLCRPKTQGQGELVLPVRAARAK